MIGSEISMRVNERRGGNQEALFQGHNVDACFEETSGRHSLERYVADIFYANYGARHIEYQDLLCSLQQNSGRVAALGLSCASRGSLFCEQYLNAPLEDYVEREFGQSVSRSSLMELGNLVASEPGQSVVLYLLVTAALHAAGVRYLVFSANRAVRSSIQRCGFNTQVLCSADPYKLKDEQQDWGTYYDGDPKVILADIRQAVTHGRKHKMMAELWSREELLVDYLSYSIAELRA